MKKPFNISVAAILFFTIIGVSLFLFIGPQHAEACGYGSSGGGDYVPERYGQSDASNENSMITKEQARQIVSTHINRLNPDLIVGNINDLGGFFEVEVLSRDEELIQLLGVDKYSGRLILLS